MSRTYYQDSNLVGGLSQLSTTVPASGSHTYNLGVSGNTFGLGAPNETEWITPTGEPNTSGTWPTGVYHCQLDVTSSGADITYSVSSNDGLTKLERYSADLSTSASVNASAFTVSWSPSNGGTGLKLGTTTSVADGSGRTLATDRFGMSLIALNGSMMSAESVTIAYGSANSYVDGPWTAAATATSMIYDDRRVRRNSLLRR